MEIPVNVICSVLQRNVLEVHFMQPPPEQLELSVPEGFNWGGCTLTWIWALCNGAFDRWTGLLLVLCFLPYVGMFSAITLMVYSGHTGNRRAWMGKSWATREAFLRTQHRWAVAGVLQLALALVVIAAVPILYEK
jgi:hypothetical protein